MTSVNDRTNHFRGGPPALKAAVVILVVGFKTLEIGLVFPLLLLATLVWPTSFGLMGWHTCLGVSIFAAILASVIDILRLRFFFSLGRTESFRQGFWMKRQLEPLVIRFVSLAVPLAIAVQQFPAELIWAAVIAFVVEAILTVVQRSWRPMPDAATIEARRAANQARREAQQGKAGKDRYQ